MSKNKRIPSTPSITPRTVVKYSLLGLAALVVGLTVWDGFARVDEGFRGIDLTFGAAADEPLAPGMHVKLPYFTKVKQLDVRQRKFEQATLASTLDQQSVKTTVAVNYHADASAAVEIYSNIHQNPEQWDAIVIAPNIQETLKSVTAQYSALQLITQRAEVKAEITEALTRRIASEHFTVVQVSITDFRFSDKYMAAIEAKQVAEQEAQRAQNELDRNALDVKKVEQQASAEKAAAITRAEGEAEALRIKAAAEADFHKQVSAAATSVSLRNREIGKWDGKTPLYTGEAGVLLPAIQ